MDLDFFIFFFLHLTFIIFSSLEDVLPSNVNILLNICLFIFYILICNGYNWDDFIH